MDVATELPKRNYSFISISKNTFWFVLFTVATCLFIYGGGTLLFMLTLLAMLFVLVALLLGVMLAPFAVAFLLLRFGATKSFEYFRAELRNLYATREA